MKTYVLDASGLLCYLGGEAGAKRVSEILKQSADGRCSVVMSVINWGEVLYKIWTARGESVAKKFVADVDHLSLRIEPVDREDGFEAARIKSLHHLPYADAFATALAVRTHGTLVTTDAHFKRLGKRVPVLWLR